jgi:hypothetical protein
MEWLFSLVGGAIAGVITAEIRDRFKESRQAKSQRKTLALAFKLKILSDLEVLENQSALTKWMQDEETASYLSLSPLWELKQVDVFQYEPALASILADYFSKLNILLSKMANPHESRMGLVSRRYDSDDVKIITDAAKTALLALETYTK